MYLAKIKAEQSHKTGTVLYVVFSNLYLGFVYRYRSSSEVINMYLAI